MYLRDYTIVDEGSRVLNIANDVMLFIQDCPFPPIYHIQGIKSRF